MDHFSNAELSYLKYIPTCAERHRYNQCLDHWTVFSRSALEPEGPKGAERRPLLCQNALGTGLPRPGSGRRGVSANGLGTPLIPSLFSASDH